MKRFVVSLLCLLGWMGPHGLLAQNEGPVTALTAATWFDAPHGTRPGYGVSVDGARTAEGRAVTLGAGAFAAPWAVWWTVRGGVHRRVRPSVWVSGDASLGQVEVEGLVHGLRKVRLGLTWAPPGAPAQLEVAVQELAALDIGGFTLEARASGVVSTGVRVSGSYAASAQAGGEGLFGFRVDVQRGRFSPLAGLALGQIALQDIEPLTAADREVFGGLMVKTTRGPTIGALYQHRWTSLSARSVLTVLVGVELP